MRRMLLFALLLGGCSKGPEADLATIREARSLAAEWAMTNDQAAKGRLTPTYAAAMRKQLRGKLRSSASALRAPGSRYAIEIDALLREPGDAPPEELRAHAAVLKTFEDRLESA